MRWHRFFPALLVLAAAAAQAEDRADLETTQVIGSRELPKVLYIVPWKPPLTGDLVGRPVTSLLRRDARAGETGTYSGARCSITRRFRARARPGPPRPRSRPVRSSGSINHL